MSREREIVIVGAGLVGSLLAVFLARRGFEVTVYERGPDLRTTTTSGGRSINLVLTHRGIHALHLVGLAEGALELTVRVLGRIMHSTTGELAYQPYGRDETECNYSIPRGALNRFFIGQAESRGVRFRFEHALKAAAFDERRLTFLDSTGQEKQVPAPVCIGADGAASAVRAALVQNRGIEESAVLMQHGYKELTIPVAAGRGLDPHALHIWPRGERMLMALPNRDGSFTVTLYLPFAGPLSFASLDDDESLLQLFETQFADAVPRIPDLVQAYRTNPVGNLGTVRCFPWHAGDHVLLIGDAAHAIVPFFGQGMNCGFEDCAKLDKLIERRGAADWGTLFEAFDSARKPNADAIADMALENFVEMSEKVGDEAFLLRKSVEHRLEQEMPQSYRSRYSMVMYSRIPYRLAQAAGVIQRGILDELCAGLERAEDLDLGRARGLIEARLAPFLGAHGILLDY